MESHKLAVKFFVEDASSLQGNEFVPIFHSWIQQKKVTDHLVIDVADYEHVPNGPGTLLITLEANFSTDREDGRLGMLYVRKHPIPGTATFAERLRAVLHPTLEAMQRLEENPTLGGKLKFRTDEFLVRIYDRLLGPNNPETFSAVKPDLEAIVSELYGSGPTALEFKPSPENLFEVNVKAPSSPSIGKLLQRLPAMPMRAG